MGLDMNLYGEKFFWDDAPKDEGKNVSCVIVDLGYWRKHPNLHVYIVQHFADGVDECQKIELDVEQLKLLRMAVIDNALPSTTGFFFGKSTGDDEEKKEDLEIINAAIKWLETDPPENAALEPGKMRVSKSVYYRASW